jgi:hypothetical protein
MAYCTKSFVDSTEEVRMFEKALPDTVFKELQDNLVLWTERYYKSVPYGTFWFDQNKDAENEIEQVIQYLKKLVMGEEDQFLGAEWFCRVLQTF